MFTVAVRGTKGRIFLYICAVLIITGIIACYNSTLSQLDEIRKSKEQCHQQQENLSTQLQVIFDYKQRLEKSLKTEKSEHQQVKTELMNKISEEKLKHEKIMKDNEIQLSALKQDYNLLKTQYEDFKAKSSKAESDFVNQIGDLEERLKMLQSTNEDIKSQLVNIKKEKDNLKEQIKLTDSDAMKVLKTENDKLKKELTELKAKYQVNASTAVSKTNLIENREQLDSPNSNKEVLPMPEKNQDGNIQSKSSTKIGVVSKGDLEEPKPINQPTQASIKPSPETNLNLPLPYAKNVPNGFVPLPDNNEQIPENKLPEHYQNIDKINDISKNLINGKDENNAIEQFDSPLQHEDDKGEDDPSLGVDDTQNNADRPNVQHNIMKIKRRFDDPGGDYGNHDGALEEDDDDGEDYGNRLVHQKELAVRH